MSVYVPDGWVVISIQNHYRVFGTWSGSYLNSPHWRLNSGITKVTEDDDRWIFHGSSGSEYHCHKRSYGLVGFGNGGTMTELEKRYNAKILPEDTDWMSFEF